MRAKYWIRANWNEPEPRTTSYLEQFMQRFGTKRIGRFKLCKSFQVRPRSKFSEGSNTELGERLRILKHAPSRGGCPILIREEMVGLWFIPIPNCISVKSYRALSKPPQNLERERGKIGRDGKKETHLGHVGSPIRVHSLNTVLGLLWRKLSS